MLRRSQLYVPGNNEKMIGKAATLGCDSVVLDLEDSVPAEEKQAAREMVARLAGEVDWKGRELCVRVNSLETADGRRDVALVRKVDRIDIVVVPKAQRSLSTAARAVGKPLEPIIETASGLMDVERVLSSRGVVAVTYGAADFALSVGGDLKEYIDNLYAKTRIVVTARALGIEAIDSVFFDLRDPEGFKRQAATARGLGYSGKQVIHPSQIDAANEVFSPTEAEVASARKVVEAYESAKLKGRGAIRVDDSLVDAVHYRLARRILEWERQRSVPD